VCEPRYSIWTVNWRVSLGTAYGQKVGMCALVQCTVQYVLYSYRRLEVAQNFPSEILWHLNNNGSLAAVCQLKECLANPSAGGRPSE
jgi:hypothetical protein